MNRLADAAELISCIKRSDFDTYKYLVIGEILDMRCVLGEYCWDGRLNIKRQDDFEGRSNVCGIELRAVLEWSSGLQGRRTEDSRL